MASTSPMEPRLSVGYGSPASPYPQSSVGQQQPSWLRNFVPSKTTKADGEAPKRRGPKPDSKPAATKRQEMNRLAQRTHRERKDHYAHELEQRIEQARITYFEMLRDQEQLKYENNEMAQLLRANGIQYRTSYVRKPSMSQQSDYYSSSPSDSFSGTTLSRTQTVDGSPFQASMSVPSPNGTMRRSPHSPGKLMGLPTPSPISTTGGLSSQSPVEYTDQAPIGMAITTDHKTSTDNVPQIQAPGMARAGIFRDAKVSTDFVYRLEHVCHEHKAMMCVRGTNDHLNELSGHALMLTSAPEDHHRQNQNSNELSNDHYHQMPDIPPEAMLRMLQTSYDRVDLGLVLEMPPIRALQVIQTHERVQEITLKDFEVLTDKLYMYMNCYGFGAVIPGYALREELENLFAQKDQERSKGPGLNGFNFNTPPTPNY
ncbi:MAG: hypothetical protein Q9170_008249 [Blastenia crenularia]